MTFHHRRLFLALLAAWVAAVAYVTLTPTGTSPAFRLDRFLCIACNDRDASDILRNWVLFLPGGFLAALTLGPVQAVVFPICPTAAVELLQLQIPGRDPALQDLIFNTLGAVSGVLVAQRGLRRRAQRATVAVAAVAWLAPLFLLIPQPSRHDYYVQWTPQFGRMAHYEGELLTASIGDVSTGPGWVGEKAALDGEIARRSPIRLSFQAASPPAALAPVMRIGDRSQREALQIGALGPDLILRGWSPARVLKLDQPDVRWVGAMDGVAVGDTVTLVIDRGRDSVCMSIDGRERCNLAPSLADGWGHILYLEGPPAWFRDLVSLMWAAGLGGLMGLASGSRRSALAAVFGVALVGYLASHISPDVRPSVFYATTLVVGAVLGALLRPYVIGLWTELRPSRSA